MSHPTPSSRSGDDQSRTAFTAKSSFASERFSLNPGHVPPMIRTPSRRGLDRSVRRREPASRLGPRGPTCVLDAHQPTLRTQQPLPRSRRHRWATPALCDWTLLTSAEASGVPCQRNRTLKRTRCGWCLLTDTSTENQRRTEILRYPERVGCRSPMSESESLPHSRFAPKAVAGTACLSDGVDCR
jgi:hypothetical protein